MSSKRFSSQWHAAGAVLCAVIAALLVGGCGGGDATGRASAALVDGRAKPLSMSAGMYEAPAVPAVVDEAPAQPVPDTCPPQTSYFTSQTTSSHYFAEDGTLMVQEEAASRSEYCGVVATGSSPSIFSDTFAEGRCGGMKLTYDKVGQRWKVRGHVEKCNCLCRKNVMDPDKPGACETGCISVWGDPPNGLPLDSGNSWQHLVNGQSGKPITNVVVCQKSCNYSSIAADGQVDQTLLKACKAACGTRAGEIIARWFDATADELTGLPKP